MRLILHGSEGTSEIAGRCTWQPERSIANDCYRVPGGGGAKAPVAHGVCKARDGVSEGLHQFRFGPSHRSASAANLHPAPSASGDAHSGKSAPAAPGLPSI
ncbi:hypothetical protein VTN96DRAFT_5744 [Rasamsonia emersonii]